MTHAGAPQGAHNPLWRNGMVRALILLILFVVALIVLLGCDVEPKRETPIPRPDNPILDAPVLKNTR